MKKSLLPILSLTIVTFYACNDTTTDKSSAGRDSTAHDSSQSPAPSNEPKTFTFTASPDTVILGKNKELFVSVKNGKGVELLDPDGKAEGTQISFDLQVTSKNKPGGNNIFFRTDNFRLTLDGGNNITEIKGAADTIAPGSSKPYKDITYRIPPGSQPKTLNLFYDDTRVSIAVNLK